MNRVRYEELLAIWADEQQALSRRKGDDYAGAQDVHANFKRMYAICKIWGINPGLRLVDTFFFFLILKLDRVIMNLHRERAPSNESLDDSIQDWTVYTALLRSYLMGE